MVEAKTVGMVHGATVLVLVLVVLWRTLIGLGWVMKDKTEEEKKVSRGMWWTLLVLSVLALATGSWFGWSLMGEGGMTL
jgi:hypothetical protein